MLPLRTIQHQRLCRGPQGDNYCRAIHAVPVISSSQPLEYWRPSLFRAPGGLVGRTQHGNRFDNKQRRGVNVFAGARTVQYLVSRDHTNHSGWSNTKQRIRLSKGVIGGNTDLPDSHRERSALLKMLFLVGKRGHEIECTSLLPPLCNAFLRCNLHSVSAHIAPAS